MNQTFEQRIQSIEDQLKEIRKELEESLERYKHGQYPFTNGDGDISKFRSGQIGNTKKIGKVKTIRLGVRNERRL